MEDLKNEGEEIENRLKIAACHSEITGSMKRVEIKWQCTTSHIV